MRGLSSARAIRPALAALGLLLATVSATASAPTGHAHWVPGPTVPGDGELTAGALPDHRELVAFGVRRDGCTFAYTLDTLTPGARLRPVPVPDVGRVLDADDSWAVAEYGSLQHDNGAWVRHAFARRPGTTVRMRDIAAAGEPWAVGTESVVGTRATRGIVQRWDGRAWRIVPVPDGLLDDSSSLTTLYASDPLFVFGVDHDRVRGDRAIALQFDGTRWSRSVLPTLEGQLDVLEDTSPQIAVGWTAPLSAPSQRRPLVYRFDYEQARWVRNALPAAAAVNAQFTAAATDYGLPVAIGNSANGGLLAVIGVFGDSSVNIEFAMDDVPPLQGAVADTAGNIVNNLWAFGYQQTPQGRKPLLLAYRSVE